MGELLKGFAAWLDAGSITCTDSIEEEVFAALGYMISVPRAFAVTFEPHAFFHFGTLLPRHLRLPQMPESVTYVPGGMMCNL
jgi:hypothetical protein